MLSNAVKFDQFNVSIWVKVFNKIIKKKKSDFFLEFSFLFESLFVLH